MFHWHQNLSHQALQKSGREQQSKWNKIAIFKNNRKVEGNSNENGRKQQFLILEKTKMEWNRMEGNSNTPKITCL